MESWLLGIRNADALVKLMGITGCKASVARVQQRCLGAMTARTLEPKSRASVLRKSAHPVLSITVREALTKKNQRVTFSNMPSRMAPTCR